MSKKKLVPRLGVQTAHVTDKLRCGTKPIPCLSVPHTWYLHMHPPEARGPDISYSEKVDTRQPLQPTCSSPSLAPTPSSPSPSLSLGSQPCLFLPWLPLPHLPHPKNSTLFPCTFMGLFPLGKPFSQWASRPRASAPSSRKPCLTPLAQS